MINIDALNDEEKLAALESIHKSIAESKEIQRKKITTNVEMIVKALKKIEADLKQRYDETGQLIANLKSGEDGRDGKDGKDGKNGKDGRDGPMGPRGYDGVPGRNGLDGTDGVSVTDAHIDFDGSLIISLSSGRVINVGEVVAADIAEKIKVITNGGGTSQSVLDALASLQAQIDAIASGLEYQGTWNASTNTPTLASSVGTAGYYYIVATAGSTNLNGITDWQIGDWAVFNGTIWQKIDQSNLVTSVAGRTGAIVLTTADIGGLGTIATQAANNVSITGGSISGIADLAIADGGTGASTANAAFNALAPSQASNSGKYLTTNGTDTSWAAFSGGTVTSVSGTGTVNGLTLTGTVTTSGSLTLGGTLSGIANSALTNSSITINGSATSLGGSINVGTVTSVAATVPSFLSIAGSPVTSSGTLAITLSGTALPTTSGGTGLTSFTTNGVVYASSTSALATGSALTFDGSKLVNTGYNKSNYQVSTGAVSTFESVGGGYLTYDGAGGASVYSRSNATTENALTFRASGFSFRIGGTQVASLSSSNFSLYNSQLLFNGATSGYTGFAAPAVSNFTVYTLPSSDGTNGQALTTNGSGTLSWATAASGSVTSVAMTVPAFLSVTGSPITSSGTLAVSLSGTALPIANGGTGQTTANAALNALLPSQTGNGNKYLQTNGTDTSWDAVSLSTADITGTLGTGNGGTGLTSFTTNGVVYATSTSALATGSALTFDGTNLGIGTTSPAGKLEVNGLTFVNNTGSSTGRFLIRNSTTGASGGGLDIQQVGVDALINNVSNGYMSFSTNNTERIRLDSSGNLGLGVTPSAWGQGRAIEVFQVGYGVWNGTSSIYSIANAYFNSGFKYASTGVQASHYYQYQGAHVWSTAPSGTANSTTIVSGNQYTIITAGGNYTSFGAANNNVGTVFTATSSGTATGGSATQTIVFTQAMTLDASGNLGIGTTSPNRRLDVRGGLGMQVNEDAVGTKVISIRSDFAGLGPAINVTTNDPLLFLTSNTERARIDSSGNFKLNGGYMSFGDNGYIRADSSGWLQLQGGSSGTRIMNSSNAAAYVTIDSSGNTGIGTTSPTEKLTVNGRVQCQWDAYVNGGTTSYAGDATSLVTGASAGMWAARSDSALLFAISSAEKMRIDSSGNLGLGVAPSAWATFTGLQVGALGGVNIGGASGDTFYAMNAYYNAGWKYAATGTTALMYRLHNGEHKWYNAPSGTAGNAITFTQAMTLDASSLLSITGSGSGLKITRRDTSAQAYVIYSSAGNLQFFNNTSDTMTLDASGNLLVGKTSGYRSGKLVVSAANASQTSTLANVHITTTDTQAADVGGSLGLGGQVGGDETPFGLISGRKENGTSGNYAGYLAFATQNSGAAIAERARIDSSGNFMIGATSSGNKLLVAGTGTIANFTASGKSSSSQIQIQADNGAGFNARIYMECPGSNAGGFGYIRSNSRLYAWNQTEDSGPYLSANGTSWTTNSDARLKTNVQTLGYGLTSVLALLPKEYEYKVDEGKKCFGFIAQDVVNVIPELVDAPEDSSEMMGIEYQAIIPVLVKAIQEQQAIIESLKARLDAANL
jgi:hypothetical protein